MIDLQTAVRIFLYVLGALLVFAIMFAVTYYLQREWPQLAPWMKILRVVLIVMAAMVAIGLILSLMGVHVFRV